MRFYFLAAVLALFPMVTGCGNFWSDMFGDVVEVEITQPAGTFEASRLPDQQVPRNTSLTYVRHGDQPPTKPGPVETQPITPTDALPGIPRDVVTTPAHVPPPQPIESPAYVAPFEHVVGMVRIFDRFGPALPASTEPYTLRPGDQLQIKVLGEPEMDSTVQVSPGGTISYYNAVEVRAANLTLGRLREELERKLTEYFKIDPKNSAAPVVSVSLVKAEGSLVHVLGAVRRPGSYAFRGNLRVRHAIALAGGPWPDVGQPNAPRFVILRPPEGRQIQFPLDALMLGRDSAVSDMNPFVTPDTTIQLVSTESESGDAPVSGASPSARREAQANAPSQVIH